MQSRQLIYADGSSDKFWNIELDGLSHTVTYGRSGTNGRKTTKEFDDEAEAQQSFEKLVEQKLSKGYTDAADSKSTGAKAAKKKAVKRKVAKKKTAVATRKKKAAAQVAKKKAVKKKVAKKKVTKKAVAVTARKKSAKKRAAKAVSKPDAVRLVFKDTKSAKFWTIRIEETSHTVTFGRQGTDGQSRTKTFDSVKAAQLSFDKLVAEKRRKGYTDDKSEPVAASAAPRSTKAATNTPSEPEVDLRITQEIDLDPSDLLFASFRKRTAQKRPKAAAANLEAAFEQFCALKPDSYGWRLPFERVDFPAILPREEAHFWLHAMTFVRTRLQSKDAVVRLLRAIRRKFEFTGQISKGEAIELIRQFDRGLGSELMLVLYSLFPAGECLEIVRESFQRKSTKYSIGEQTQEMAEGLMKYLVPYATAKEITEMQRTIRKSFDPSHTPPSPYESFPAEHYFAAALGMHKDVAKAVSGWEDDFYKDQEIWYEHYQNPQRILFGLGSSDAVESEWRRLHLKVHNETNARGFLACTEFSALDILADSICEQTNKDECSSLLKVLSLVRAPEAAEPMLQCRLSSKTPSIARDWLAENVGNAVAGLIETAANRGKLGDAAIDFLRSAKRDGHESLIAKCVKKAGKKSAGAVRVQKVVIDYVIKTYQPFDARSTPKWLKTELAAIDFTKPPKLPAFAVPGNVPMLTVGDHKLNDDQMTTVLQVLATTEVPQKHSLLTALRDKVDKTVRDDFAWQMFELWREDGANSKSKWAMGTIGHLGDDQCVLKLTPLIRTWPGESQHARAVFGLQCLRGVGSSIALMQLSGIAQKLKFKGLKTKAAAFVNEIAEERGMTRAELEDRVIPDCGLDEMGRREISYGSRSFSFVLSGDLKAMVKDGHGKVRPNPPKPSGKDDAAVANASLAEWKTIKKQIKEVATLQSTRLEQAMVTGRRWPVEDFESLLVRHPLMTHLVQKLIWGTFDRSNKRKSLFPVTEERDYADAKDNTATLAKSVTVGLIHPLEMTETERSTWGEVLSDYELIAPFPQLGREVYSLEKGEHKDKELKRYHDMSLYAPTMVFTLEKLGWTRGVAMDAGGFDEHSKQFPSANVTAVIGYDGIVGMGYIDPDEQLTTDSIHFCPGMRGPSGYRWDSKKKVALGKVPDIVLSEVLADLNVLKSKAQ